MKHFCSIIICLIFFIHNTYAQAPQKINYQSIIRDSSGLALVNRLINTKISLKHIDSLLNKDTTIYIETHLATTNNFGLINFAIGTGAVSLGNFSEIDWSTGNIFVITETDPDGGQNYQLSHKSELLSVPFALFAANSTSHNNILSVKDFGAKGDATTDDSQAFINAIDSAKRIGTRVYVPAGNYRTTKTIEIPGGVSLIGEGIGNTPLQSPFTGSMIRYEGNGFAVKINEHLSMIKDLGIIDRSGDLAQGGILIEANNRLAESIQLNNILVYGFTNGTGLKLSSINNGGIAYCSFYDIRIRHAKVGIHIIQDNSSFTNSNAFFHGAISGGGFDYGILIDNGNNNIFNGMVIEPPASTLGHLVVKKGEVQCTNIRIEGSQQDQTTPLILFNNGTMNSIVTGTYGGGLTIDRGNNTILLKSSKSLSFQNSSENQFLNSSFSGTASSDIPEWTISGSGVTYSILTPELSSIDNVLKITVPSGVTCHLQPTASARPVVKSSPIYQQLNFGCNVKTAYSNTVFTTSNSPSGVVTSTPYSGSNQWEFIGMNALVDTTAPLDAKFLITNNNGSDITVYITTPTLVFGNQSPTLNSKPLSTSGGKIYGLLTQSMGSIQTPTNGFLVLPRDANYFDIENSTTITRINHLLADRFPKGSAISLLFKNAGVNVTSGPYLILKAGFTSIANSSLTLISNGDGTWREVQRNN